MNRPASNWGDLAAERDALIAAVIAFEEWRDALSSYNNTAYKGDGLKAVEKARGKLDCALENTKPIIDKYRR